MDSNNESHLYRITTDNMMKMIWQEGQTAEMQIVNKMLNGETSNLRKTSVSRRNTEHYCKQPHACKTKQKARNNIIRKMSQTR